jgi:hypothetical protein
MCEPMGRREIIHTFSLLVEIEGYFTNEFVSYVHETEDRILKYAGESYRFGSIFGFGSDCK